jgi:hypothetical protein
MAPHLSAGELMAAASAHTGLHDYGDRSFVEPFEQLVAAVNAGGTLDEAGRAGFAGDMIRLLGTRLAIEAAVAAHPEILDEDVSDPIVITGLPRTGTTKLHRVLATDPRLQKLVLWRGLFPAPLAPPGTDPDPRIAITDEQVAAMAARHPDLMAAHPWSTHEPEEDGLLLQLTFRTLNSGWVTHGYSFIEWVTQQDQTPAYADLRRTLQYLQWQDGGRRGRPWLLKAPIHLSVLGIILAVFPGATVVHCHRDLHETVASAAKLYEIAHVAFGADHVELEQIGRNTLMTALGWEANLAQRPAVDPAQILDVDYEEICSDVRGVIGAILARRGLGHEPETLAAIAEWERANPQYRNGRSQTSLDRYGLTPQQVDEAFAVYTAAFSRT